MEYLIIICSCIIFIYCYSWVSKKEKSSLNFLFPYLLIKVPINFLLEPAYIYFIGYKGDFIYPLLYVYSTHAAELLFITAGYLLTSEKEFMSKYFPLVRRNNNYKYLPYIFMLVSYLLFSPVIKEYGFIIFKDPRSVYTQTRTGYGIYYFLSNFFATIAVVLILFKSKAKNIEYLIVISIYILLGYLHGTKSIMFTLIIVIILFRRYLLNIKLDMSKFVLLMGFTSGIGLAVFYFTINYEIQSFGRTLATYSDYNRNAMLLIKRDLPLQYGQNMLETNFYARIPRALMPTKPKDFGIFGLAKYFHQEWFEADTGAPSYGIGNQYIDFGFFSIFYIAFWGWLTGRWMKICVNRLKYNKSVSTFIILLFLAGIDFLHIGAGYLLVEHILLAVMIRYIILIFVKLKL